MLGVNTTLEPKVQRCFAFERGRCHRGDGCKFIHSVSVDSTSTTEHVSISGKTCVSSGGSGVVDPAVAISGSQRSSRKVCRHFRQKGRCDFGEGCAFLHTSELHHDASVVDVEPYDQWGAGKSRADLKLKSSRAFHGIKEKKVCKFYKAGYCRYGQKCHYRHLKTKHDVHEKEEAEDTLQCHNSQGLCNNAEEVTSNKRSLSAAEALQVNEGEGLVGITVGELPGVDEGISLPAAPFVTLEQDLSKMRETEIQQLRRRFPKAQQMSDNENTTLRFIFEPTDPDWPYDVKHMNIEISFPEAYPSQMMTAKVIGSERIPPTVERPDGFSIEDMGVRVVPDHMHSPVSTKQSMPDMQGAKSLTESIQSWITERYNKTKASGSFELVFRPMLQWMDKNAENLMTEALKEYKRELMAKAAGLEFIPAAKLRQIYPDAVNSVSWSESESSKTESVIASSEEKLSSADTKSGVTAEREEEKENVPFSLSSSASDRKGTEVTLCGLQLTDGAATVFLGQVTLIVACTRCTNTNEARLVPGQAYAGVCSYCHANQLMEFKAAIAHHMSSVVGWLNLDGCRAYDLVVADCQFLIGCINCSKEEKIISMSPGQHNTTWCRHCHQKLTVVVDNVRFVQLSTSAQIDTSKTIQLDVKKRVKSVHDPAIQEGQPLPHNGTCRHFKKSFRWLRFPCCGKAYPCDMCHNDVETDHEMKLANRMICGFCAKEQAYASERPCVACSSLMTNKTTAFWEGGRGCRDQVKMCSCRAHDSPYKPIFSTKTVISPESFRIPNSQTEVIQKNDPKKYTNLMKTASLSCSERRIETGKKITKLRHVS